MMLKNPHVYAGRRVVVFGAGYVGLAFARLVREAGAQVVALTRNEDKARALAEAGIKSVLADLADVAWHEQIDGAVDFAVNCVSSGGGGIAGYQRSYVDGMRSIATWAKMRGAVGTLLYTSSTSVYPQDGGVTVDESLPTDAVEGLPRVLLEAERLLLDAGQEVGRRAYVLRLAGIYGPSRHHILDQLREGTGEVAGQGGHRLNLIYRDDIVRAIDAALSAPANVTGGVFNVADDGAATKAEVVGWLAQRLGVPMPRFSGVAVAGRRAHTPDRVISNEKMKQVLGWHPLYASYREGYAAILGA